MRVAGIQLIAGIDKGRNLEKAEELIRIASHNGARIICLPELFNTHWFPMDINQDNFKLAEDENGSAINLMKKLAGEVKSILICPIFEKDEGDYYNTAFVIDENGNIIGKYRKVHIPQMPLWEERAYFKPGNTGFSVFATRHARIGIQICWDNFFPEGSRIVALKGAQIIFAPTACGIMHSHAKWERAISANAHANGVFIFRVNRIGREERQEFYGRSFCVGPDGEFLDKPSGKSEGIVISDINLKAIDIARREWQFLKDRRPCEYSELAGGKAVL